MRKLLLAMIAAAALAQGAQAETGDIYGVSACYTFKDPAYQNGCTLASIAKNPTFASKTDCKAYVAGANQMSSRNNGSAMSVSYICVRKTVSTWEEVR
ncbi:hypothetical protein [Bradyrhizobium sp. BRP23]|uniref:hypothetical protein n=1 Tax=Bradyrhizobium sp. BRP23 TaxID=2793820 RepID=UPI001CD7141B|nr:hypothetical protein [Bradyrhizobium sp. BRP23]MCA1419474.1 hypothetical protein [Bradyrhizobium sp. BRP23]